MTLLPWSRIVGVSGRPRLGPSGGLWRAAAAPLRAARWGGGLQVPWSAAGCRPLQRASSDNRRGYTRQRFYTLPVCSL